MKGLTILLTIVATVLFLGQADSFAQKGPGMMWRGSGGWGPGSQYNRMFDPKTMETVSGEVTGINQFTPAKGMRGGIHVNVKTDKETISVHLGPSWYLENQDVKIEPKDRVEVKGSRIVFGSKPAIIAAEVRRGQEVLTLRDESGLPAWMAWRRR